MAGGAVDLGDVSVVGAYFFRGRFDPSSRIPGPVQGHEQ